MRRWLNRQQFYIKAYHFAIIGMVIGFLTSIVISTGPINVPAFIAYGLVKGSFISTEAFCSLLVYAASSAVFSNFKPIPKFLNNGNTLRSFISGICFL
ncbi:hypothetical protein [Rickettsia endosymbiont of Halotydeus destructor]|uniref:hypothetical protein n=1 Tax=Rickettsia endosymbiont of Halotydeus destructor TaxID=2996754 RepID=UPI003BAE3DE8